MLIVVSDGGDNASKIKLDEVLKRVRESDATVYTVALVDPLMRDGSNPRLLRRLARSTGGEFYRAAQGRRHSDGLPEHRAKTSATPTRSLTRRPAATAPRPARRRKVNVYVRSQDGRVLTVRTRDGYFEKLSEDRQ